MSVLQPSPVSTRQFNSRRDHDGSYTLTAEMSDLSRGFRFGRVYDDACDEGLTLVSHVTGRQIVFAISSEDRDSEGDLQAIHLTPAIPGPSIRVTLWND